MQSGKEFEGFWGELGGWDAQFVVKFSDCCVDAACDLGGLDHFRGVDFFGDDVHELVGTARVGPYFREGDLAGNGGGGGL